MRLEKAAYALVCVGPGGRGCPCCAPIPRDLKRQEHRRARRIEQKQIEKELLEES
jgi:hypothetical protein